MIKEEKEDKAPSQRWKTLKTSSAVMCGICLIAGAYLLIPLFIATYLLTTKGGRKILSQLFSKENSEKKENKKDYDFSKLSFSSNKNVDFTKYNKINILTKTPSLNIK